MLIEEQNGNFAKPVLGVVLSLFDGMSCGQIALIPSKRESTTPNIGFAKCGVSCFKSSLSFILNFVFQIKFSRLNPALRKAEKRYLQMYTIFQ